MAKSNIQLPFQKDSLRHSMKASYLSVGNDTCTIFMTITERNAMNATIATALSRMLEMNSSSRFSLEKMQQKIEL
jgi:hypothetical protein